MLSLVVDVEITGSASSAASVFIEGSFSKQDYGAMATAYSEQVIAVLGESGKSLNEQRRFLKLLLSAIPEEV